MKRHRLFLSQSWTKTDPACAFPYLFTLEKCNVLTGHFCDKHINIYFFHKHSWQRCPQHNTISSLPFAEFEKKTRRILGGKWVTTPSWFLSPCWPDVLRPPLRMTSPRSWRHSRYCGPRLVLISVFVSDKYDSVHCAPWVSRWMENEKPTQSGDAA